MTETDSRAAIVSSPAAAPVAPAVADTTASVRSPVRGFVWHYLQMLIAMMVGMMVLAMPARWLLGALGASAAFDSPVWDALIMATNMTIGMSLWMWFRKHTLVSIVEMGAAMYVSFAVLFPPYWMGSLPGEAIMGIGHLLMLPAMLGAMLWRRHEHLRHR
ncbi:MAG: hypothetical protein ACRDT4_05805 [Micromonosporaceae bacterium]